MPERRVIKQNIHLHKKKAEEYEEEHPDIFNERERERISSVLDRVSKYINTDGSDLKALDLGCGTGNILTKLKNRFGKVVGVDLSRDMLDVAERRVEDGGNCGLVRGRVSELPFSDDTFDFVSGYSLLHHLPSFSEPVSEISRVLKDGGVLYFDHEPVGRDKMLVRLYTKFRDMINGESHEGFPPYEETDGLDREFCDFHIHHGGNGGLPGYRIVEECKEHDIEIIETEKYLSYGSGRINPFYPIFNPLIDDEWLLIGRKDGA